MTTTIHSAKDLGAAIRDLTGDSSITDAQCRDHMHRVMDESSYERMDGAKLHELANQLTSARCISLRQLGQELGIPHTDVPSTLKRSGAIAHTMFAQYHSVSPQQIAQAVAFLQQVAQTQPQLLNTNTDDGVDADF